MRKCIVLALLLGFCAFGCAESSTEEVQQCNCRSDQVCEDGVCFDTCSDANPCANRGMCVNHICRDTQEPVCKAGAKRCSADMREIEQCSDGYEFVTIQKCSADESCDSAVCIPNDCEEGTKRCNDNTVEICTNRQFVDFSTCGSDEICDESVGKCVKQSVCVDGVKRCSSEGNIEICENGDWIQAMGCPKASPCQQATLDCGSTVKTCSDNERKCADAHTLLTCVNDNWSESLCGENEICSNGECREQTCGDDCNKPVCGDGNLDDGESCDTTVPESRTCATELGEGYTGTLSCTSTCTIDTSLCSQPTPPVNDWVYIQTFDNLPNLASLTNTDKTNYKYEYTWTENQIEWSTRGRLDLVNQNIDYSIDGKGIILSGKSGNNSYIKASGFSKGVGTLSFDYRVWKGDSGKVTVKVGDSTDSLEFSDTQKIEKYIFNANVNAAEISIEASSGGRIIIDNVRWTNR